MEIADDVTEWLESTTTGKAPDVHGSTNVPVGNALGVRGDMDIIDAYMDVGGRVMQEQLPSDLFLIFPYGGLYSKDGKKE